MSYTAVVHKLRRMATSTSFVERQRYNFIMRLNERTAPAAHQDALRRWRNRKRTIWAEEEKHPGNMRRIDKAVKEAKLYETNVEQVNNAIRLLNEIERLSDSAQQQSLLNSTLPRQLEMEELELTLDNLRPDRECEKHFTQPVSPQQQGSIIGTIHRKALKMAPLSVEDRRNDGFYAGPMSSENMMALGDLLTKLSAAQENGER